MFDWSKNVVLIPYCRGLDDPDWIQDEKKYGAHLRGIALLLTKMYPDKFKPLQDRTVLFHYSALYRVMGSD